MTRDWNQMNENDFIPREVYREELKRSKEVERERDALADALVEIYEGHAIDSGCSPNSITAKAIISACGEEGSDRAKLFAHASERSMRLYKAEQGLNRAAQLIKIFLSSVRPYSVEFTEHASQWLREFGK